jgi:hypothetical protein
MTTERAVLVAYLIAGAAAGASIGWLVGSWFAGILRRYRAYRLLRTHRLFCPGCGCPMYDWQLRCAWCEDEADEKPPQALPHL